MSDNYFMGLDGFVWFIGVVEDRNDPAKLGRVKVRCLGFHTEDKTDIPTEDLPWAHVMHPVTDPSMQGMGSTPSFLVEGSWVIGFFRDATEKQQPIIMGSLPGYPQTVSDTTKGFNDPKGVYPQKQNIYSGHELNESDVNRLARVDSEKPSLIPEKKDAASVKSVKVADGTNWNEPDSAYDPFYPYNHVYESESGHIKEFDDSVGTERIHEYHRRGTFYEVSNTGDKSTRVIRDNYEVIKRNDFRYVKGDLNLTVSGKLNIKCKNFNLEVEDDLNETIGGKHKTFVSGIQSTTVNGAVTKTYTKNYTGQTIGTTSQRYGDAVTNFYLATTQPDSTISIPTLTNHHEADVLHKVTGEVEFNTTTNFEIISGATVDIDATTSVLIDSALVNLNSGGSTDLAARKGDTVDEIEAAGVDDVILGGSATVLIGSSAPTTTTVKEIEKTDPVTITNVFLDPYEEVGTYGSAGGAPNVGDDATAIASAGVDNQNSLNFNEDPLPTQFTITRSTLGNVSAKYESGGRDDAYAADTGGYFSYGRYQLYSKGGRDSVVGKFIEWAKSSSEFKFIGNDLDSVGADAAGSTIDSIRQPFVDKWKEVAVNQPDLFKKAQHDYIQATHYEVAVAKIKSEFGLDADDGSHSAGLQDAIWSTAVQHGPNTNVFKNAFTSLGYPTTTISEITDVQLIAAIYDERSRVITTTDVTNFAEKYASVDVGKLIYFRNYLTSFPNRQASLENRYTSEKSDALALA